MIRRPPRSTQSRSSAASDVYKRQMMNRQQPSALQNLPGSAFQPAFWAVSYTHLRAHETRHELVCRLLLEKKNTIIPHNFFLIGIPVTTNQLEIIFYCH